MRNTYFINNSHRISDSEKKKSDHLQYSKQMNLIHSDIENMLQSSWAFYCELEISTHSYWWWIQCFWEWRHFHCLIFMLYINIQKIGTCLLQSLKCLWWSEAWTFHHDFWQAWWKWLQVLTIIRYTQETKWMNQETYKKSIVFKKFWSQVLYEKTSWTSFSFFLK